MNEIDVEDWVPEGRPHVICKLKVALYSFFAARGIGTSGASARVFLF